MRECAERAYRERGVKREGAEREMGLGERRIARERNVDFTRDFATQRE